MKKPTPDEILAFLAEIGKTISVKKLGNVYSPWTRDYALSNGWQIRVFDECESEWHYLEAVKPPGGEWVQFYHDEHVHFYDPIINHYSPSKVVLDALGLS